MGLNLESNTPNGRYDRVIRSLTLEEKCDLLSGINMWETTPIPRLGIGSLKTSDGPAGVRGSRWTDGTHTTFIPCGISLGATWDPELIRRVGGVLGSEAKCKGVHVLLAPTMNMSRSPFGGRNFENFGEDPLLTGLMATAYITGIQEQGVGACMKHFVANDQETRRFNMDQSIDERTMREIYLRPFEMAARLAKPWTAMTAYPKINGEHADVSQHLVRDILRSEWGFDELVMSDWGGLNDTVGSIKATTDLEMPGPTLRYGKALAAAVVQGDVSEADEVDPSVRRLLRLLDRSRLLDNGASTTPQGETGEGGTDTPEFRRIARQAASEGIVLLKNEGDILPLRPLKMGKLAIIGPNSHKPTLGGTGSAVVNPYYTTNPLDSLREAIQELSPDVEISHEPGIFTHLQPPLIGAPMTRPDDNFPGFRVDFYEGQSFSGDVVLSSHWHNSLVYFMSDGDVPASLLGTRYSYRANGVLKPTECGTYDFSLSSTGKARLYIDDKLLIDNFDWETISGNFMNCGSAERVESITLEAGREYQVRVDNLVVPPPTKPHDNTLFHKISGVRVGMLKRHDEQAMFSQAVDAARNADAVVMVVGHNNDTEREGSDRTSLHLPGRTDELVKAICGVNKNVTVVTQSACAIGMPWVEDAAAIVHAWYQGQEAGNALIDVLLGRINPCGKLPVTFPKHIEDHGSHKWFPGDAETDKATYGEGILVGYRWFDEHEIEPLWPFGFGLSYTSFEVSNVTCAREIKASSLENAVMRATVKNTGESRGSEVIQTYVSASDAAKSASQTAAPRSLAGFCKVTLAPGESKSIEIGLDAGSFRWFDPESMRWRMDEGVYKLFVGTSSRHFVQELEVFVA